MDCASSTTSAMQTESTDPPKSTLAVPIPSNQSSSTTDSSSSAPPRKRARTAASEKAKRGHGLKKGSHMQRQQAALEMYAKHKNGEKTSETSNDESKSSQASTSSRVNGSPQKSSPRKKSNSSPLKKRKFPTSSDSSSSSSTCKHQVFRSAQIFIIKRSRGGTVWLDLTKKRAETFSRVVVTNGSLQSPSKHFHLRAD